jgi:flagellar FliJ protein
MKRFKFKLENVLKYRATLEDLAKNEYRDALRILNIERDKLQRYLENRRQLGRFYDVKPGAVIHPDMLAFVARYTTQLASLIHMQKNIIKEKESIANDKFQAWNIKRKDVKVVEKLKEKKWQQYKREMDKADQIFQDEIYIAKQIRESRENIKEVTP